MQLNDRHRELIVKALECYAAQLRKKPMPESHTITDQLLCERLQQVYRRHEVRNGNWLSHDDVPNRIDDINAALRAIIDGWHEDRNVPKTADETYEWVDKLRTLHSHMDNAGEYLIEHLHVLRAVTSATHADTSTCEHNWVRKADGFACMKCGEDAVMPS